MERFFSLIFHTPFVVFERKEHFKTMKSRLDTLLSMMNCLQRKQNNMDIGEAMSMEFDGTDKLIKQEKKKV